MKIKLLIIIIVLTSLSRIEGSDKEKHLIRDKLAEINISLMKNEYPNQITLKEIRGLFENIKNIENPVKQNDEENREKETDKLAQAFKMFGKKYNSHYSIDTLKQSISLINNYFLANFGKYFLKQLNKANKKKIIIFCTSLSCECTLEMCNKQIVEIQEIYEKNKSVFEYAIVDCDKESELQKKYKVGFLPTVILYDVKVKETKRFVREVNLLTQLNKYLK